MDDTIGDLRAFITDISKGILRELDVNILKCTQVIAEIVEAVAELDV